MTGRTNNNWIPFHRHRQWWSAEAHPSRAQHTISSCTYAANKDHNTYIIICGLIIIFVSCRGCWWWWWAGNLRMIAGSFPFGQSGAQKVHGWIIKHRPKERDDRNEEIIMAMGWILHLLLSTAPNRSGVIITSGPVNANLKAPSSPLLQVIKQSVFNLITLPFRMIVQQQQRLRVLLLALIVVVNCGRIPQQGSMCTYKRNKMFDGSQVKLIKWIGFVLRASRASLNETASSSPSAVAYNWLLFTEWQRLLLLYYPMVVLYVALTANSTQIRWSDRHENLLIAIIKLWELDQAAAAVTQWAFQISATTM